MRKHAMKNSITLILMIVVAPLYAMLKDNKEQSQSINESSSRINTHINNLHYGSGISLPTKIETPLL